MIFGIGTDLVDSRRIDKLINKYGYKFLNKFFSKEEIENSNKTFSRSLFFSKRFAGKEAFWKAISPEKKNTIYFKDIEILSEMTGRPYIKIIGKTKNLITNKEKLINKNLVFDVSLSDEPPYALAFIIISLAQKK